MAAETLKAAVSGHCVPPLEKQFRLNDTTYAPVSALDTLICHNLSEDITTFMHEELSLACERIDDQHEDDLHQEEIE